VVEASLLLQKRTSNGKAPARLPAHVIAAQRKAHKVAKKNAKAVRVAAARARYGAGYTGKRPANAKITFGKEATARLDALGLHKNSRKHAKNYHKKIMKAEMAKIPEAATGRVFHLVHEGGSDPNEKSHMTAGVYKLNKEPIKSPWALEKEKENPGSTPKGLFHFYPENHRFRAPKAFVAAAAESQARQEAAAAEAQAAKEAEKERINREKQDRAAEKKRKGKLMSEEEKKAARSARKDAKKGLVKT